MKNLVIKLIQGYQRFNSWLRQAQVPGFTYSNCKFHPSCSEYAVLAVERHGPWKGLGKAGVRILRCNPLSHGGVDYP